MAHLSQRKAIEVHMKNTYAKTLKEILKLCKPFRLLSALACTSGANKQNQQTMVVHHVPFGAKRTNYTVRL